MLPQRMGSHEKIRKSYLVGFYAILVNKNKIAMLRTIDKDATNPERQTLTSVGTKRPRKKVGFGSPEPQNREDWGTISSFRPRTTPLITRNINQTLNTTARSSNIVHLRSIALVQSELKDRYKEDMNPYLRKKLRRFVERKQENFVNERPFESTIDSNEWDTTGKHSARRPIQQFYSSFHVQGKPLLEKGVDEAYLLTAKERIVRLIQMKKQRENQYKSLNSKIKAQRASNQEQKGKNRFQQFKKQTIDEEEWDQKWREDLSKQNNRYRNRLIVKCSKQNSPFFSLLH